MSEELKAIARRFFKAFENNDQVTLYEVLARDLVIHVPGAPDPMDRETHVQGISKFNAAFSEIRVNIEDQIAESDKVASHLNWQAIHTGDFQGLAPTGEKVKTSAVSIERIKDGKIVERWFIQDQLGLMQQLGVVPPEET